ncbi:glycine cleavage system protein GcvH [Tamaricihabitans halophyticus]|uniref:glycine cleavage system protein GcvH n=1 Tax=Tamaricihabitans halophyticus TaxID=1262583 RepID=UPI001FB27131|nr:glycine cleavage system protein GcvH [Tamaricihabitans halophyticus]
MRAGPYLLDGRKYPVVPEELKYTEEHEWIAVRQGDSVRIGITDYAQTQLGEVVFVELPEVGQQVGAGDSVGEIESTKSVSEVYAPLNGSVTAVNEALADSPELINSEPYGEGWMFEIAVSDAAALDTLLDAAAYRQLIAEDA